MADLNDDGLISRSEEKEVGDLGDLGVPFGGADADGDGKVSRREILVGAYRHCVSVLLTS